MRQVFGWRKKGRERKEEREREGVIKKIVILFCTKYLKMR